MMPLTDANVWPASLESHAGTGAPKPAMVDGLRVRRLSHELGVALPKANTAVLVGTKLSATAPYKDDPELQSLGIELKTLWGHLAWQLGGWSAYQIIQTADDKAVAPGEELGKVLAMASPCIILIDELVAYGRKLERGIPGGTLESNLSFIQTLTALAKATPGVIVAASVPESDMEIGGVQGQQVLARIQETMGRVEAAWQPVQPTESFEVVRRRLFEKVDPDGRDQAVAAFTDYYRKDSSDFPAEVQEKGVRGADEIRLSLPPRALRPPLPGLERCRVALPVHPRCLEATGGSRPGDVAGGRSVRVDHAGDHPLRLAGGAGRTDAIPTGGVSGGHRQRHRGRDVGCNAHRRGKPAVWEGRCRSCGRADDSSRQRSRKGYARD